MKWMGLWFWGSLVDNFRPQSTRRRAAQWKRHNTDGRIGALPPQKDSVPSNFSVHRGGFERTKRTFQKQRTKSPQKLIRFGWILYCWCV